jgi:hypothetical protein
VRKGTKNNRNSQTTGSYFTFASPDHLAAANIQQVVSSITAAIPKNHGRC